MWNCLCWILSAPFRSKSHGGYQYILDFSRKDVVDCIYEMMAGILRQAKVSYMKWDKNSSITECFSPSLPPKCQGEMYHLYILGLYDLYGRLAQESP